VLVDVAAATTGPRARGALPKSCLPVRIPILRRSPTDAEPLNRETQRLGLFHATDHKM